LALERGRADKSVQISIGVIFPFRIHGAISKMKLDDLIFDHGFAKTAHVLIKRHDRREARMAMRQDSRFLN